MFCREAQEDRDWKMVWTFWWDNKRLIEKYRKFNADLAEPFGIRAERTNCQRPLLDIVWRDGAFPSTKSKCLRVFRRDEKHSNDTLIFKQRAISQSASVLIANVHNKTFSGRFANIVSSGGTLDCLKSNNASLPVVGPPMFCCLRVEGFWFFNSVGVIVWLYFWCPKQVWRAIESGKLGRYLIWQVVKEWWWCLVAVSGQNIRFSHSQEPGPQQIRRPRASWSWGTQWSFLRIFSAWERSFCWRRRPHRIFLWFLGSTTSSQDGEWIFVARWNHHRSEEISRRRLLRKYR